jgi:hypothetical protein
VHRDEPVPGERPVRHRASRRRNTPCATWPISSNRVESRWSLRSTR